jgi:hypothetical protein
MAKKNTTQLARKALLRRGRALLRLRQEVPGEDGPDFLAGLSEVERRELEEIHAALERIERGIFGRCEECGDKIDPARIERLPYVRDCAGCADAPAELDTAATAV